MAITGRFNGQEGIEPYLMHQSKQNFFCLYLYYFFEAVNYFHKRFLISSILLTFM